MSSERIPDIFTASDLHVPYEEDAIVVGVPPLAAFHLGKISVDTLEFRRTYADGPVLAISVSMPKSTIKSIRFSDKTLDYDSPITKIHAVMNQAGARADVLVGGQWIQTPETEVIGTDHQGILRVVSWPGMLFEGAMTLVERTHNKLTPNYDQLVEE